jgi:hypothetical protein
MAPASSDIRSPKRPGQSGTPVLVRWHEDQLALIDAWRAQQPFYVSRPEAIRQIVEKGLKAK